MNVRISSKYKALGLLILTISLITTVALTTHSGLASAQNNTLMQSTGTKNMATNNTNIVLYNTNMYSHLKHRIVVIGIII